MDTPTEGPTCAPPRHALPTVNGWRWPAHIERLAHQAAVRHVMADPEEYPGATVSGLERLAESVLCGIAPHIAAKDARIAELLGVVHRLRAELDGELERQDVHFERTADAADGAERVRAW